MDSEKIIIQNATSSNITLKIGDEIIEIQRQLAELSAFLKNKKTIQTADKIYNIESINEANFNYIVEQANKTKQFPEALQGDVLEDEAEWVNSLEDDFLDVGLSFSDDKLEVFSYYGWLIRDYLRKLIAFDAENYDDIDDIDESDELDENDKALIRFSFMAKAFDSSIRYLCFIQLAQLFKKKKTVQNHIVNEFINLEHSKIDDFDYLDLLLNTTYLIDEANTFVPEIHNLVRILSQDMDDELYETVLFLEKHKDELLQSETIRTDNMQEFNAKYLTALIYWLRKLAFLGKYKLVSVKNINVNFVLGGEEKFVHLYGELHSYYRSSTDTYSNAFKSVQVKDTFTYTRSVLLLKSDTTIQQAFRDNKNYLSLSPLIIDKSVFINPEKAQTPEIYYFAGRDRWDLHYAKYNNELSFLPHEPNLMFETVKSNNDKENVNYNTFHKHVKNILKPYKTSQK